MFSHDDFSGEEDFSDILKEITTLGAAYEESFQYRNNEPDGVMIESQPIFNEYFGGFRASELTILCGATGTGKSSLLANWSADLVKKEIPHLVASIENGYQDFVNRQLSVLANFECNDGDKQKILQVKQYQDSYKHFFRTKRCILTKYGDRVKLEKMLRVLLYAVKQGAKVAMLDNLNFFLEAKREADMIVEMDRVIHALIMFTKQYPIHIILIMHPKKTVSGRVLSEYDIKGSSTAVQEAHNVLLFNRLDDQKIATIGPDAQFVRQLTFAKVRRRGKIGLKSIYFNGSTPQYKEIKI